MSSEPRRVVVVGAGIVGLAAAWYLRKLGFEVVVVDRGRPHRDGCSFGNAGMLVPSHVIPLAAPGMVSLGLRMMTKPSSPFYIKPRASMDLIRWMWLFKSACTQGHVDRAAPLLRDLHFRSRELYQELEAELPGGFGLVTRGLLMLCKTQKFLDEEAESARYAKSIGVRAEILDRKATAELDPEITMDVVGSVHHQDDCHLSPNKLMASLQQQLESDHVEFQWHTSATGIEFEGDRIRAVSTDQGMVEGDEFVICSGIWSSGIARDVDVSLPMQAGKGYSMTVEQPRQLPRLCSLLGEARVAATPIGECVRFGGTMEMAGIDESITEARVQGIREAVPQYFPEFHSEDLRGSPVWSGLRPCSPDGLPYLGRTNRWKNLIVSTGHAMMGISLALVSGELVAEFAAGRTPSVERLSLASPDRYR
ncbi:MAG: FAD-dependent oxidoreductase [Planctomycetota bacterium]